MHIYTYFPDIPRSIGIQLVQFAVSPHHSDVHSNQRHCRVLPTAALRLLYHMSFTPTSCMQLLIIARDICCAS